MCPYMASSSPELSEETVGKFSVFAFQFSLEIGGRHTDTGDKEVSQTFLHLNVVYRVYFGNWPKREKLMADSET